MTNFVTQCGESFVGEGANAAHINTVLGAKGGPVEAAWVSSLAHPTTGHIPFVTVLQPGLAVKPFTLFVNKASIASDRHAEMTWGAAQAGVAKGVADAVADGVIDAGQTDELLLIAAVWVNSKADDAQAIYTNHARATLTALAAGKRREPDVADVLSARQTPFNPFFRPAE